MTATTANAASINAISTETWLELRDRTGRLWGKYDPHDNRLEFRRGGVRILFELQEIRKSAQATRQPPKNVIE